MAKRLRTSYAYQMRDNDLVAGEYIYGKKPLESTFLLESGGGTVQDSESSIGGVVGITPSGSIYEADLIQYNDFFGQTNYLHLQCKTH